MAKSPLKRPAAKPASKNASKPVVKTASKKPAVKPVVKGVASKAAASKSPAKPAISKAVAKPAAAKTAGAKRPIPVAAKTSAKSVATIPVPKANPLKNNGSPKSASTPAVKPVNGKATPAAAPAAKSATKPLVNGKPDAVAAKPAVTTKPVNGSKPVNVSKPAAAVAAPVEAPKPSGRPMLMQGPVASKSLTKKGTFVLTKPNTTAPKLIKRKIEPPPPTFVALQPPVPQVKTSEKAVKNRAGLNQRDLDYFRDLLLQKRRELVGDMSHMEREALRETNANLASPPTQTEEQGTDAYEQEFTLGLVEKDRTLLREINDAMAKLQNGTYGICEGTGEPISRPRLEAQPWARHSIEFARILEKRKMVFRR